MPIRESLPAAMLTLFALGAVDAKPPETAPGYGRIAEASGSISPHAKLMQFLLQPVEDPNQLRGRRVAILAADGVDGFDLDVPRSFLAERGAVVHILVPRLPKVLQAAGSGAVIKARTQISVLEPSGEQDTASFDRFLDQVSPADYDVVYLPGHLGAAAGVNDGTSIAFLQEAARAGKSIFAAGNAPLVLLQAGLLEGGPGADDSASTEAVTRAARTAAGNASVYSSRDAFDMPELMAMLVATLLARPAAQPQ
jgi:protease I